MFHGRINRSRWVSDLKAIMDHEALPRVVLLGHSLGAEIALDFAAAYPDSVAGLVLIDPVFHQNLHGVLGWVRRLRYVLWIPVGLLSLANALGLRRRHYPPRDMYALDQKTRATLRSTPGMKIADLYINPLADLSYIPLANYLQDLLAVVQPVPELEAIDQPVLRLLLLASLPALAGGLALLCLLDRLPAGLARRLQGMPLLGAAARLMIGMAADSRRVLLTQPLSFFLLLLSTAAQLLSVLTVLALVCSVAYRWMAVTTISRDFSSAESRASVIILSTMAAASCSTSCLIRVSSTLRASSTLITS